MSMVADIKQNTIMCGDCVEILKGFPDNYVDLTVTSPPYDNLRDYDGYSLNFPLLAEELFRVTKDGGVIVWVAGDAVVKGSETGTSFRQALHFKEIGLRLHDTMIYQKKGVTFPSNNRYFQAFEYMFVFSKGKPKTFNPLMDRHNLRVGEEALGKYTVRATDGRMIPRKKPKPCPERSMRYNVWELNTAAQERPCKPLPHPAQFPLRLARDHILSWSNQGDLILDPMCGAGTTLLAAAQLNRNFIGIEISHKYCEIASNRLEQETIPLFFKEQTYGGKEENY